MPRAGQQAWPGDAGRAVAARRRIAVGVVGAAAEGLETAAAVDRPGLADAFVRAVARIRRADLVEARVGARSAGRDDCRSRRCRTASGRCRGCRRWDRRCSAAHRRRRRPGNRRWCCTARRRAVAQVSQKQLPPLPSVHGRDLPSCVEPVVAGSKPMLKLPMLPAAGGRQSKLSSPKKTLEPPTSQAWPLWAPPSQVPPLTPSRGVGSLTQVGHGCSTAMPLWTPARRSMVHGALAGVRSAVGDVGGAADRSGHAVDDADRNTAGRDRQRRSEEALTGLGPAATTPGLRITDRERARVGGGDVEADAVLRRARERDRPGELALSAGRRARVDVATLQTRDRERGRRRRWRYRARHPSSRCRAPIPVET